MSNEPIEIIVSDKDNTATLVYNAKNNIWLMNDIFHLTARQASEIINDSAVEDIVYYGENETEVTGIDDRYSKPHLFWGTDLIVRCHDGYYGITKVELTYKENRNFWGTMVQLMAVHNDIKQILPMPHKFVDGCNGWDGSSVFVSRFSNRDIGSYKTSALINFHSADVMNKVIRALGLKIAVLDVDSDDKYIIPDELEYFPFKVVEENINDFGKYITITTFEVRNGKWTCRPLHTVLPYSRRFLQTVGFLTGRY